MENRFPKIWVPSGENRDLRQLLWHRHRMVQARMRMMNQLQAVALRVFFGMLTYSLLATLYLVYVGVKGEVGILLWPAVAAHAGLSVLLVRAWRKEGPA